MSADVTKSLKELNDVSALFAPLKYSARQFLLESSVVVLLFTQSSILLTSEASFEK